MPWVPKVQGQEAVTEWSGWGSERTATLSRGTSNQPRGGFRPGPLSAMCGEDLATGGGEVGRAGRLLV